MLVANDIRAAALRTVATPSKAARMRIELKRLVDSTFQDESQPPGHDQGANDSQHTQFVDFIADYPVVIENVPALTRWSVI
jgi:hypothetical protein